jgi:hypothetical protein
LFLFASTSPHLAEEARVETIIEAVVDDLRGAVEELEIFEPRKQFCIGVLTPPHLDGDASSSRRRRNPESIGFSARIHSDSGIVTGYVSVEFTLWYRIAPSYDDQRAFIGKSTLEKNQLKPVFRSYHVTIEDLPFTVPLSVGDGRCIGETSEANRRIEEALDRARSEILTGRDRGRIYPGSTRIELRKEDLLSPNSYSKALEGDADLPIWRGRLTVVASESSDGWRLMTSFSNATSGAKQHQAEFFDSRFDVRLGAGEFFAKEFVSEAGTERYTSRSWGRGINGVLEVDEVSRKSAKANTLPRYRQPRPSHRSFRPASDPDVLAEETALTAIAQVLKNIECFRDLWRNRLEKLADGTGRERANKDLVAFEAEIESLRLGERALKSDPRLLRAFCLMNEAASPHLETWRPFQIAFILLMMPSLVARETPASQWLDELKRVDVLWFPTGGGKSEAIFAVILTALFYDRLRGKKFGVSAWIRYPLRMLSIQQLQRLVEFVTSGDRVKSKYGIDGDPFTVGYYVGEANTPNRLTDRRQTHAITHYAKRAEKSGDSSFLRVLQKCPYIDCSDPSKIDVIVESDIKTCRIKHYCHACSREAPIYISDSEIYRYLPSVLVGTVDRLARAGQTDEFGRLYGQVDGECPQHGYSRHGICAEGGCGLTKRQHKKIAPPYDPVPALLVQDELHLLKESLGTYDAHYEGFLDSFAASIGTKQMPKRIAATATIEGAERHVRELYGLERHCRRFPVRGPLEIESAYIEPSDGVTARVFVGILPTGMTSDQVSARIARVVHEIAERQAQGDKDSKLDAQYDVTLIYANTKDSLGNIGAELKPQLERVRSLTGERSLEEVRQLIDVLRADEGRPLPERTTAIVSTSIISHGVDVSRLNVIAFSAAPGKAADYIQAASRIGREHVGLVFMVFDPTRNMDRSTFTHFIEYHERLYALVQPVPIIRFSQSAVQRTFNGVFAATLINTINAVKNSDLGYGKIAAQKLVAEDPSEAEMLAAVSEAYGIAELPDDLRKKYMDLLERACAMACSQVINNSDDWSSSQRLRPKPVASLREVQEQVAFDVTPRRHREVQQLKKARQ